MRVQQFWPDAWPWRSSVLWKLDCVALETHGNYAIACYARITGYRDMELTNWYNA